MISSPRRSPIMRQRRRRLRSQPRLPQFVAQDRRRGGRFSTGIRLQFLRMRQQQQPHTKAAVPGPGRAPRSRVGCWAAPVRRLRRRDRGLPAVEPALGGGGEAGDAASCCGNGGIDDAGGVEQFFARAANPAPAQRASRTRARPARGHLPMFRMARATAPTLPVRIGRTGMMHARDTAFYRLHGRELLPR